MRPAIKGSEYLYEFALARAPAGMRIDSRTGAIVWTAPAVEGVHDVEISLKDSGGRTASQTFTVTVSKAGCYFLSSTYVPDQGSFGLRMGRCEPPWAV